MVEWTPEMSVGVGLIDKQHQEFVALIDELTRTDRSVNAHMVTGIVLMKLDSYARYHFSTEEEYFVLFGYPGAEEHVIAHRMLLKSIKDFIDRFFNQNEDVAEELGSMLFAWLNGHLMTMDRKYTRCFNEHGLR